MRLLSLFLLYMGGWGAREVGAEGNMHNSSLLENFLWKQTWVIHLKPLMEHLQSHSIPFVFHGLLSPNVLYKIYICSINWQGMPETEVTKKVMTCFQGIIHPRIQMLSIAIENCSHIFHHPHIMTFPSARYFCVHHYAIKVWRLKVDCWISRRVSKV